MPIEPVFEKVSAKEKSGEVVCQIKVECKTDVPAESVEKIINDSVCATVNSGEIKDGRAEIIGKATFFICYSTADGLKKCECGAEIKDSLISDAIREGDTVKLSWISDKVETDLSGLKMTVSAYLTVKGEFSRTVEHTALTGGENVFCNLANVKTVKSYGTVSTGYATEEEFELGFAVAEVVSHRAEVCLTAVQCGVGSIICDGEIYLTEILLQSGEKNDIIRENRVIPFRAEAECEDAMPQLSATCRAFVKSLKTDVSVDQEKGVSVLTAKVSLGLTGEAFGVNEEALATDAFNTDNELSLVKSRVNFFAESAPSCVFAKVSGRAVTDDIGSARIVTAAGEKTEVVSVTAKNGGLSVSGALTVNVLFVGEDGKVFSRKAEVPFETEIACDCGEKTEIIATPKSASVKLVTLTEIECEAEVVFTVYSEISYSAEIISALETGDAKPSEDAAVSVYIPLSGEGLWELSKRLNVCPETLIATNSDLQFPLTGKERIVVYRQK